MRPSIRAGKLRCLLEFWQVVVKLSIRLKDLSVTPAEFIATQQSVPIPRQRWKKEVSLGLCV